MPEQIPLAQGVNNLRDGTPCKVEFRVVHPSGEVHGIASSVKVYYAPSGNFDFMLHAYKGLPPS